jgi:hypothetical protein
MALDKPRGLCAGCVCPEFRCLNHQSKTEQRKGKDTLFKVALVRKWHRPDRFDKAGKVTISRTYQIDARIIWLHIQCQSVPLRWKGFCPVLAKRIIRNRTCADPYMRAMDEAGPAPVAEAA